MSIESHKTIIQGSEVNYWSYFPHKIEQLKNDSENEIGILCLHGMAFDHRVSQILMIKMNLIV